MKKWVIPLSSVPPEIPVHQYLIQKTDFLDKVKIIQTKNSNLIASASVSYNLQNLNADLLKSLKVTGLYSSKLRGELTEKVSPNYLSASLTWNPNSIDAHGSDPHVSTLGSKDIPVGSYSVSTPWEKKNNYTDSYSFNHRTPLSMSGELGNFFDSFNRTLVRSRVSVIMGNQQQEDLDYSWHNDENIFINLRINIPLSTTPLHVVQLLDTDLEDDKMNLHEFHLEVGKAYAYNTEKLHRPLCRGMTAIDRVHLICGISPWFDFDREANEWFSNEFFGELHPFEILTLGHVSPFISS